MKSEEADCRLPNGWRYPLVGGTRQRHFIGNNFKPRKLPENAQTPTSRVHAVLGGVVIRSLNHHQEVPHPSAFELDEPTP